MILVSLAACGDDGNPGTDTECGDGTREGAEQCDDGNTASGDGCSASCTTELSMSCGNGATEGTEQCDDGNITSGDGCSATCTTEGNPSDCGNGMPNTGETCDDGDATGGDGCSGTCQTESGYTCTPATASTPSVCTMTNPVNCGNGMPNNGETCDDGDAMGGDGCSATCQTEVGFTCTPATASTPSVCTMATPAGTCAAPFIITLTDTAGVLAGTGAGNTMSSTNQVPMALCNGGDATTGAGKDHVYKFTTTDVRDVSVRINGTITMFDTVLRVLSVPCDPSMDIDEVGAASATAVTGDGCSDASLSGETIQYTALPAGTYYVVVDGYSAAVEGAYSVDVTARPTLCGNGAINPVSALANARPEFCDDGDVMGTDGCNARCEVETGFACTNSTTTTPASTCVTACGNGDIDPGEECDDGALVSGDRCSATCLLESNTAEVEPNGTAATAQVLTAGSHIIRGSFTDDDVDLYTFTLAAPATVHIEVYDTIDTSADYEGVGTLTNVACEGNETVMRLFAAGVDPTMNNLALYVDDDDGDQLCSYLGPQDSADDGSGDTADTTQGVLAAGTYTIKVEDLEGIAVPYYILDLKIVSAGPVAPAPGDFVINEVMAADNLSDTNCDGSTTDTVDEFIELVNVSVNTLDLAGVAVFETGVPLTARHTFAAGTTVAPGQSIVLWGGGVPACPGVTNFAVAAAGLGLNDTGDTITIKSAGVTPVTLATLAFTDAEAEANVSLNRSPDVTGTVYALHNTITGAVGAFTPGKRANNTAF